VPKGTASKETVEITGYGKKNFKWTFPRNFLIDLRIYSDVKLYRVIEKDGRDLKPL
jgi:hypothetical protein